MRILLKLTTQTLFWIANIKAWWWMVMDCNVLPIQHLRPSETNKKSHKQISEVQHLLYVFIVQRPMAWNQPPLCVNRALFPTNQLLTHCCMSPRSALLGICTFPIFSGIKLILYNSYLNPIHNHKTHIFHLFLVLIAHTWII